MKSSGLSRHSVAEADDDGAEDRQAHQEADEQAGEAHFITEEDVEVAGVGADHVRTGMADSVAHGISLGLGGSARN